MRVCYNLRWSEELSDRTAEYAKANGISKADVIRWALSEKMARKTPDASTLTDRELTDEVYRRAAARGVHP